MHARSDRGVSIKLLAIYHTIASENLALQQAFGTPSIPINFNEAVPSKYNKRKKKWHPTYITFLIS